MRPLHPLVLASFLTLPAACSSRVAPAAPPAGGVAEITVEDNQFRPDSVAAAPGSIARWTWRGTNLHTVTFDDGPESTIRSSGTYERTFANPGTYTYYCRIHGRSMSGTISVIVE